MGHNPLVSNRDENPSAVEFLRGISLQNQQMGWLRDAIVELHDQMTEIKARLDFADNVAAPYDDPASLETQEPLPEAEPTPATADAPATEAAPPSSDDAPKKKPGRPKKTIAEAAGAEA